MIRAVMTMNRAVRTGLCECLVAYANWLQREEKPMPMLDWNTYRQQIVSGVGEFSKLNPGAVKGYAGLSNAGQAADLLGAKTVN